jgi:hypothetical protein
LKMVNIRKTKPYCLLHIWLEDERSTIVLIYYDIIMGNWGHHYYPQREAPLAFWRDDE